MQSLKNNGKEMSKIESKIPVYNGNQGPLFCSYLSKFIHLECRMSRSRRVLAIGGKQRSFGLHMVCFETVLER